MHSYLEAAAALEFDPSDAALAAALAEVTTEGMAEAMAPCPGSAAITIVGDLDKVKPSLDDVRIKYTELDWQVRPEVE